MKAVTASSAMDYLPDEIILIIFNYSSVYDLTTSFQRVCTRWNHLINGSDRIWRGNVRLKGLAEGQCQNRLCSVLRRAPKLRYLQIGESHAVSEHRHPEGCCGDRVRDKAWESTESILEAIRRHNKDLEYLHVIDRYPLCDGLRGILRRPKFKRLEITLDKLCARREIIKDLRRLFRNLPEVDNLCIDFCQRIRFRCEKKDVDWVISHDFDTDTIDKFN